MRRRSACPNGASQESPRREAWVDLDATRRLPHGSTFQRNRTGLATSHRAHVPDLAGRCTPPTMSRPQATEVPSDARRPRPRHESRAKAAAAPDRKPPAAILAPSPTICGNTLARSTQLPHSNTVRLIGIEAPLRSGCRSDSHQGHESSPGHTRSAVAHRKDHPVRSPRPEPKGGPARHVLEDAFSPIGPCRMIPPDPQRGRATMFTIRYKNHVPQSCRARRRAARVG